MKHKDHYDEEYVLWLANELSSHIPTFDKEKFILLTADSIVRMELYDRFDLIVSSIRSSQNCDYDTCLNAFYGLLGPELKKAEGMFNIGWRLWPIGRYVEIHGLENWELSLGFIKELTKRFTGEYAIRPLLREHPKEVMDLLISWSKDDNVHVRRLASEGVRIRLPWSQKLNVAIDEFDKYVTILTNLKDDSEKFVQKSVGNNLNDLYKDAPEKANEIIASWKKGPSSRPQEWIIKHGMRNQT
jgi:DNA alkylation repair enzyme